MPKDTVPSDADKQLPVTADEQRRELQVSASSLESYIHWVNQIPMLSPEEEHALASQYRQDNDWEAARRLVLAHLRFVVHVARQYYGYGLAQNDLIQEGNIGLMKAVKRYDPDRGVRLVSYALPWIKSEIYEFIMRNLRSVRIPKTKTQLRCLKKLTQEPRRNALSKQQIKAYAEELNVNEDTVKLMEVFLSGYDEPFDAPQGDTDDALGLFPSQYLVSTEDSPECIIDEDWASQRSQQLQTALQSLDERSRDIIESRWLTDDKLTLEVLAKRYGVSTQRIQQLERAALKKLKTLLSESERI